MQAYCRNPNCTENGVKKEADDIWLTHNDVVTCGECCQPCEVIAPRYRELVPVELPEPSR